MSEIANIDQSAHTSDLEQTVQLADLPPDGFHSILTASDAQCREVAERLGVDSVERISADISVSKAANEDIYVVAGSVSASVVQACVVTLEPLFQDIVSDVDLRFMEQSVEDETDWDLSGDQDDEADPPELAIGGEIDLGDLIVQQMALDLDPFPRSPDAPTANMSTGDDQEFEAEKPNPFAELAALRDKLEE